MMPSRFAVAMGRPRTDSVTIKWKSNGNDRLCNCVSDGEFKTGRAFSCDTLWAHAMRSDFIEIHHATPVKAGMPNGFAGARMVSVARAAAHEKSRRFVSCGTSLALIERVPRCQPPCDQQIGSSFVTLTRALHRKRSAPPRKLFREFQRNLTRPRTFRTEPMLRKKAAGAQIPW